MQVTIKYLQPEPWRKKLPFATIKENPLPGDFTFNQDGIIFQATNLLVYSLTIK